MALKRSTKRAAADGGGEPVRSVLWLLVGGLFGQMTTSLPLWTTLWCIFASMTFLVLSYRWRSLSPTSRKASLTAATLFGFFCAYKAYREYTGANYPLWYRVCGAPVNAYGFVDNVTLGLEFANWNKVDLYLQPVRRTVTIADRNAAIPMPSHIYTIHPSTTPDDDAKLTDLVQFDPPLTPKQLDGYARYEFVYGPSPQRMQQTLIIEGVVSFLFSKNQDGYAFRFGPSEKTSKGYSGPCNIRQQTDGDAVPQI